MLRHSKAVQVSEPQHIAVLGFPNSRLVERWDYPQAKRGGRVQRSLWNT
jgi:hypothetical protein